ncbi:MAG: tRNA (N(6)-L-threonylcarbamoyladenosine(37)-C(2))-methylthiotransferase MtaB [Firmicutes bacterium]|nr:tRNA (N(6)-L-threonylcarbamoyladenosine(37)-C(2))-methylthiotransferase MtaB [Bacillota bacterium]
MSEKRVAFYTLGCKLNQYDTQSLLELFRKCCYNIVDFSETAHVYVINTCTVTGSGERKSRQAIRRAVRQNPEAVVVVTGCYAQTAPGDVAGLPGVDLVIGNQDRAQIVELVEKVNQGQPQIEVENIFGATEFEELPIQEFDGRARATLKIQDGCNQFCTYCKIPFARGPSRSRRLKAIVEEAKRLVDRGFGEVVLTGIHLGAYGADLDPAVNLAEVIRALEGIDGLKRLRLGSVDVPEIDEGLCLAIKASEIACHHLHIPLQAGDDEILKAMRRPYTAAEFQDKIDLVRHYLPNIAITTDVIVGFPGETDRQFQNGLDLVRNVGFTRLHVFRYSPRSGTAAARFPKQVPGVVKRRRSREMIALGHELSLKFHKSYIGQKVEVLWEEVLHTGRGDTESQGAFWIGHTDTYVKVTAQNYRGEIGDMSKVAILSATPEGVFGDAVEV